MQTHTETNKVLSYCNIKFILKLVISEFNPYMQIHSWWFLSSKLWGQSSWCLWWGSVIF